VTRHRIAYVTGELLPDDPDLDLEWALEAFAKRSVTCQVHRWDADVEWAAFDAALIRSPWDYHRRRDEFLAWADRAATVTTMHNPPQVMRANTHKSYLLDLAAAGVPVIPTTLLRPGHPDWQPGDQRVVVKPAVSAGAADTVLSTGASARAHADWLLAAGRDVLVQPYLAEVEDPGEVAVVFIDGAISHAVRKVPALTVGGHGDPDALVPVTEDLAAAAHRVIEAASAQELLFARVDLVPVAHQWLLLELELTEPTLFLEQHPAAAEALADGLLRRLR
jgi:glutathione synthase/RimK-type ligase-like ATP-grasp enzyme